MGSLAVSRPSLSFFPMRNPYGDDIPAVATKAEAIDRLKSYVAAAKPGETLLTWGYDVVAMGGALPTASELDGITTTVPLIIWDASEHYAFANSAALKKYTITDDMVAKTIGAGRNPDGSSNGQFLGTDAARLILPQVIAEQMAPDAAVKNLKYLAALMQQSGVTTLGDLFFGGVNIELETLLSQKFFTSPASVARVVHVPDGYTYAQAYGDSAVSKVLELKSLDRPRHGQRREVLCRRRFRSALHAAALAGLYRAWTIQRALVVFLQAGLHRRHAPMVERWLQCSRARQWQRWQPGHAGLIASASG